MRPSSPTWRVSPKTTNVLPSPIPRDHYLQARLGIGGEDRACPAFTERLANEGLASAPERELIAVIR
ncbi:unnamed protein product [Allacma fusca]|uniref:Uncharacterized protein n=1 Tax=Allacma fusca TaxID=39272 RepID=A0A8J2LC47_9HEXA|nr:unnamed protein product [Allacma fusca]